MYSQDRIDVFLHNEKNTNIEMVGPNEMNEAVKLIFYNLYKYKKGNIYDDDFNVLSASLVNINILAHIDVGKIKDIYVDICNKYGLINVDLIDRINNFHNKNNIRLYSPRLFTRLYVEYVQSQSDTFNTKNTLTSTVNYFDNSNITYNGKYKKLHSIKVFIKYYYNLGIVISIYSIVTLALFFNTFFKFYNSVELPRFKFYIGLAKGTSIVIYFNIVLILLFSFVNILFNYSNSILNYNITKNTTFLQKVFNKLRLLYIYLPFYLNNYFHYVSGSCLFIFSLMHTIGHTVSFSMMKNLDNCCIHTIFNLDKLNLKESGNSVFDFLGITAIWTGILLIIIIILNIIAIILYKYDKLRHTIFFVFHVNSFLIWLLLILLHGSNNWLRTTETFQWILPVFIFYIFTKKEKIFYLQPIKCIESDVIKDKFIRLEFYQDHKITSWFKNANMDIHIAFPKISKLEWHRFSIVSTPDDRNVVLFIKIFGKWTKDLKKYIIENPGHQFNMYVERFNNNALQYYKLYKKIVFIANGIGINTFASFIIDYINKKNQGIGKYNHLEPIDVIWIINDYRDYSLFYTTLTAIHAAGYDNEIKLFLYFTYNIDPFSKTCLEFLQHHIYKQEGYDIISGLYINNVTIINKPNFDIIFQNLLINNNGLDKIGLFFCGNKYLKKNLLEKCYNYSNNSFNLKLDFYDVE